MRRLVTTLFFLLLFPARNLGSDVIDARLEALLAVAGVFVAGLTRVTCAAVVPFVAQRLQLCFQLFLQGIK